MRACEPDYEGYAEHEGMKIGFEVFGDANEGPTLLFVQGWQLSHSRLWKAQVPYLARHYRVVTFDAIGNGRSTRSIDPEAYSLEGYLAWTRAVLDATRTERAIIVSLSGGPAHSIVFAGTDPDRVEGMVLFCPIPLCAPFPDWLRTWDEPMADDADPCMNESYVADHYDRWAPWFVDQILTEPHSTKQIEDTLGWAAETEGRVLTAAVTGIRMPPDAYTPGTDAFAERDAMVDAMVAAVQCPTRIVLGTEDRMIPVQSVEELARRMHADLVVLEGSGHVPLARDPVRCNHLIREFVDRVHPPAPRRRTWPRAQSRRKRALFVSSPIGLGHVLRDVAIAQSLREQSPGLEIEWLAQHPVTDVLEARGERIHPASRYLVSESRHVESESGEHDLHCFQALRRMDEILVANFHVFDDVVTEEQFDLWVGDEAWDVDYFLHENPERKRAAYCWLTDFVGFVPMPDGGEREAALTADYNAEMIEQVERFGRIRDRALFVGNPDDIVPLSFGPDLPGIREWTERHFAFPGYVTGFDAAVLDDRDALRAELGWGPDEQVCVVTVGGSGVGTSLLRKVVAAYADARERVPNLRMVAVAGPRIDPAVLDAPAEVAVHAFVPDLYRQLAACDVAVVQGGLTTTMELTANRRPFLYFPLADHFEQQVHVPHRLDRYGAGRRMDYGASDGSTIAAGIADALASPVDYLPVENDGADRAAGLIAEML
jgi:pimeloyl-ACP methyl ester carboxylesterase